MLKKIREDIRVVFDRDPAARHWFDVVLNSPGLHAVWMHRLAHWFWALGLKTFGRFCSILNRFFTGVEIHPGAQVGSRFFIDHGMGIVIGETAEIGEDCTLYHGVTLGGTTWNPGKRHPTLGNNVVVGAGAKVLGPIEIGSGARIGSNAVVIKPVPPDSTAIGIPARILVSKSKNTEGKVKKCETIVPKKVEFEQYGVVDSMPDPIAGSINTLAEQLREVELKLKAMENSFAGMNLGLPTDMSKQEFLETASVNEQKILDDRQTKNNANG